MMMDMDPQTSHSVGSGTVCSDFEGRAAWSTFCTEVDDDDVVCESLSWEACHTERRQRRTGSTQLPTPFPPPVLCTVGSDVSGLVPGTQLAEADARDQEIEPTQCDVPEAELQPAEVQPAAPAVGGKAKRKRAPSGAEGAEAVPRQQQQQQQQAPQPAARKAEQRQPGGVAVHPPADAAAAKAGSLRALRLSQSLRCVERSLAQCAKTTTPAWNKKMQLHVGEMFCIAVDPTSADAGESFWLGKVRDVTHEGIEVSWREELTSNGRLCGVFKRSRIGGTLRLESVRSIVARGVTLFKLADREVMNPEDYVKACATAKKRIQQVLTGAGSPAGDTPSTAIPSVATKGSPDTHAAAPAPRSSTAQAVPKGTGGGQRMPPGKRQRKTRPTKVVAPPGGGNAKKAYPTKGAGGSQESAAPQPEAEGGAVVEAADPLSPSQLPETPMYDTYAFEGLPSPDLFEESC